MIRAGKEKSPMITTEVTFDELAACFIRAASITVDP